MDIEKTCVNPYPSLNIHLVVFNPASNRNDNEKQGFIALMKENVANLSVIGNNVGPETANLRNRTL